MKYITLTRPSVFGHIGNLSLTGVTVNDMQMVVMNLFQYKVSLILFFCDSRRQSIELQD